MNYNINVLILFLKNHLRWKKGNNITNYLEVLRIDFHQSISVRVEKRQYAKICFAGPLRPTNGGLSVLASIKNRRNVYGQQVITVMVFEMFGIVLLSILINAL